jgi:sortase A
MIDWLRRFGSYALIFGGVVLLTSIIPSAAGPADALAGEGPVAVPASEIAAGRGDGLGALLIGSPRRGPLPSLQGPGDPIPEPTTGGSPSAAIAVPSAAATAQATAAAGSLAPTAAPTAVPPEPTAAPAPPLPPTSRIVIPRIGVDAKVVDVGVLPSGEMETAAFAAGRLTFGADAGEAGNAVIAGHNDIEGEVFRRLPELKAGDEVVLYRGEQPFRYRVELRTIVREDGATPAQRLENAQWMAPTEDATCTLVTCYPYRVDTHRVIVRARLVQE